MNFKLKPLVASIALIATGAVYAAGFTPPESAPAAVERLDKALERNHNGRFAESDWFRRITISGELNVDATMSSRTQKNASDTNERFGHHSSSDIALADANLYVGTRINDWVMANMDLIADDAGLHGDINQDHVRNSGIAMDEAYATIGNFRESPVYVLAGREYVPFGYYVRHPITAPLTQLLSQTNATALQVGFVDVSGFNGAAYAFRNKVRRTTSSDGPVHRVENGGLQVGYRYDQGDMGVNLDASWLFNMNDVDSIAATVGSTHVDSVDAYSLVAQGHYQNFDGEFQYVAAADDFNTADIAFDGDKARPRAWLLGVGYSFPAAGHASRVGINYQRSREARNASVAGLPKRRWQADYTVNVWKNTDVAFQYVDDKDYKEGDGGTGRKSRTGIVSLRARFA